MLSSDAPPPAPPLPLPERILIWAAGAFLLLPLLLISSPGGREAGFLVFGALAMVFGFRVPAVRDRLGKRPVFVTFSCLAVIHLLSVVGGVRNGEPLWFAMVLALQGLVGVAGVAVIIAILAQTRWHRLSRQVALGLAGLLLVGSLAGYLIFIDWHLALGGRNIHFEPRRLALVWITRAFTSAFDQQFWSHANDAGYLFAAAWVVLVEMLSRRGRWAGAGWFFAALLAMAVFLTASRSAFLMMAAALPFLLAFRPPFHALKTLATLALAVGLGIAALQFKIHRMLPPPVPVATEKEATGPDAEPPAAAVAPPPVEDAAEIHTTGIIDRGSAGRLHSYRLLWEELEGHRWFGRGLTINRQPFGSLMHEHSSYLATLRAGGIPSLVAHLVIIAIALGCALILARRGCRWPLVFAVAIFTGLLFDRSTVIRLTGFNEFLTHWFAVLIPIVRLHTPQAA